MNLHLAILELSLLFGVIMTIAPFKRSKAFYKRYLNSWTWKKRRLKQYHLQNGLCGICKKPLEIFAFECHHVNGDYGTLGNELDCDLLCLHLSCHNKEHARLNNRWLLRKSIDWLLLFIKRCYYSNRLIINDLVKFIKRLMKRK